MSLYHCCKMECDTANARVFLLLPLHSCQFFQVAYQCYMYIFCEFKSPEIKGLVVFRPEYLKVDCSNQVMNW